MAQIFHSSANTIAKISLVVGLAAPVLIIGVASAITRSSFNTNTGVPRDQPIPFSHEHHATELGIDCRYCHSNVEKSATAGVPPTQTCMSCHSQIWTNSPLLEPVRESYRTGTPLKWTKVNEVPEFVYFNHSIHVNRGISCNECHGPVQQMQITYREQAFRMAWCVDCHKNPERHLYTDEEEKKKNPDLTPREQVFNLYWKYQTDPTKLTHREERLVEGEEYSPSDEELEKGKQLVAERHIQKKQLADCWICHR